jgi:hypothetical protein
MSDNDFERKKPTIQFNDDINFGLDTDKEFELAPTKSPTTRPVSAPKTEATEETEKILDESLQPFTDSAIADNLTLQQAQTIAPDIGIWGPVASGKTAYLAAALHILRSRIGLPDGKGGKNLFLVSSAAETNAQQQRLANVFLARILARFAGGERLAATPMPASTMRLLEEATNLSEDELAMMISNNPFSLYVSLRDSGRGMDGRFHKLAFMDAAGEFVNPNIAPHVDRGEVDRYWDHLRQAKGLLVFLDGARYSQGKEKDRLFGQETYGTLIQHFLAQLAKTEGNTGFNKYVAICITKADLIYQEKQQVLSLTPEDVRAIGDDISDYSLSSLETPFVEAVDARQVTNERSVRVFLTSAGGWNRDDASNMNEYGEVIEPGPLWRPYQVAYPLMWLFDQIENERIVATRKGGLRRYVQQQRKTNLEILVESSPSADELY